MRDRKLSVEVEGYKSIGRVKLEFRPLNILIGANGAGKSNFLASLNLMSLLANGELGYGVGYLGGASRLLNRVRRAQEIKVTVEASNFAYRARLMPSSFDELIFEDEALVDRSGADEKLFHMGRGHRESKLASREITRSSAVPQQVANLLRGFSAYHFSDTASRAGIKTFGPTADNLALRPDARNLAAILMKMRYGGPGDEGDSSYRRIVSAVRTIAPFFQDFVLEPEQGDNVRLRWREVDSDTVFSAEQMSDGTLRFVALATLLMSPEPPTLVLLDEPELGLHPAAVAVLADLLTAMSRQTYVVVATQSVTLVNQFGANDLVVVERSNEGTILRRPDMDRLAAWLDEYALGDLWEKNIIGGRPGRAGSSLA